MNKFIEALKILGIEEYKDRIFNSNSHGELFHLNDYVVMAEYLNTPDDPWFGKWFRAVVEWSDKNSKNPNAVFQHIPEILKQQLYDGQFITPDGKQLNP